MKLSDRLKTQISCQVHFFRMSFRLQIVTKIQVQPEILQVFEHTMAPKTFDLHGG